MEEIQNFKGTLDAVICLQDFLFDRDEAIPDDLRVELRKLVQPGVSPVTSIVEAAERIYARKEDVGPELMSLGASLALVAEQFNFHGMASENRGSKIALAFTRDGKLKTAKSVKLPKKEDDPLPDIKFIKKQEEQIKEE